MSIKIRPEEPVCIISLTKEAWLSILVYLTEFSDQTATEEIFKVVEETIKQIREVILSKEPQEEYAISVHRDQALDLYIQCRDFKDDVKDGEVMLVLKTVTGQLKEFLIGGAK